MSQPSTPCAAAFVEAARPAAVPPAALLAAPPVPLLGGGSQRESPGVPGEELVPADPDRGAAVLRRVVRAGAVAVVELVQRSGSDLALLVEHDPVALVGAAAGRLDGPVDGLERSTRWRCSGWSAGCARMIRAASSAWRTAEHTCWCPLSGCSPPATVALVSSTGPWTDVSVCVQHSEPSNTRQHEQRHGRQG